ncbi:cyclin domain-containing protein [Cordyceps javanica]|uniref:RNA polymerase II holoenzyme cyclin-like subunit n=1 Tax=Cordyceps javanica TaxID=43265 RepID=A0A545V612_9HYPO|nr:cyclin domain-containing protein [Cordyceps javanica]TQW08362.1 cyclin domain containing protein [Cordyceps javanica]
MASIDRYRPPREGYQPPTAANAPRQEQPAPPAPRSPTTTRREVPPAAPTPPQLLSRHSPAPPPRSQQGVSGQHTPAAPAAASGSQTPLLGANQWSFTADEVLSTPSVIDGISPEEERLRRAKGVNFVYQAGVMLDLPQITLWVAGVFFHRFYMRFSMVQEKGGIHHYNIAATALFLANKVEENCRKTKDIIIAVAKVAQKNAKLIIDEQSKEYWRWRDSILTYEEVMLEQLTFDMMVDNPYRNLFELLGKLDIVHNKHLRQAAWAFCNDACLTALPLLVEARDVAISAIFFASAHANQQIDDVRGEPWWRYLRGDEARCATAVEVMRQFYTENPLRKQNPSLPSPAFHLEHTRRRGDAGPGSGTDPLLSPNNVSTPRDRDSHSPAVRTNGDGGGAGAEKRLAEPPRSQPADGDTPRSTTTTTTVKRKEGDAETVGDGGRSEKRARLSEDEGEVEE